MLTHSSGIVQLTVTQTVEQLSRAYSALIASGTPLKSFPSVMLWGPPGVGKSQGVRQIAQRLRQDTGKTVKVTDVRLLLFNPVDLRGITLSDAQGSADFLWNHNTAQVVNTAYNTSSFHKLSTRKCYKS